MKDYSVVINGAGIAGLTLANCLQRLGISYCLVEKASSFQPQGAGIILQDNGLAVLKSLGLMDELDGASLDKITAGSLNSQSSLYPENTSLNVMAVHRADLHKTLLKKIPKNNILFTCRVTQHEETKDGVNIILSNGREVSCKWLIEASGLHGDLHCEPNYFDSEQWCWRTVVSGKEIINQAAEYWFGENRLGIIHLGDAKYYVFQVLENGSENSDEARLQWLEELSQKNNMPMLNNLDLSDVIWLSHSLMQREINWGRGRVIAIGDAAHALTPNMGQGAVLGMEDAYTLSELLANNLQKSSSLDSKNLLEYFVRQRHYRVQRIQSLSLKFGKVAHWKSPFLVKARDLSLRFSPAKIAEIMQKRWMSRFIDTMGSLSNVEFSFTNKEE